MSEKKRTMTPDEIRYVTEQAGQKFDTIKNDLAGLSQKQLFIKAFLLGREFTLDELGCLDADNDDIFEGIE